MDAPGSPGNLGIRGWPSSFGRTVPPLSFYSPPMLPPQDWDAIAKKDNLDLMGTTLRELEVQIQQLHEGAPRTRGA